ncbi:MAG: hypothetical protein IBX39_08280 [Candidatus Methanoperedenaceae archaeon]|nr:hypothetical protein [Candidatus Methanoperedenaceae archaeon]
MEETDKITNLSKQTMASHTELKLPGQVPIPILGHLTWYSVKETRIPLEKLRELFNNAGIPPAYLPEDPSPINAFKRATTELSEVLEEKLDNNRTAVYLVRQIASDDVEIVKSIMREVRDKTNKRLSYNEVGRAHFDKDRKEPRWYANNGCEKIIERLEELYSQYEQFITAKQIRAFLHRIIHGLDPTLVRPSGAVYFIPHIHSDMVARIETLMTSLEPYGTSTFNSTFEGIPLIDAEKTRAIITARFEEQNTLEVDRALNELTLLLKSGNEITPATAGKYVSKVKDLRSVIEKYESLLQTKLAVSKTKTDVLQQQVTLLIEKVGQKPSPTQVPTNGSTSLAPVVV